MAYLIRGLIADINYYRLAARDESLCFLNVDAAGAVGVKVGFGLVVRHGGVARVC